jgi:hypothetical protein
MPREQHHHDDNDSCCTAGHPEGRSRIVPTPPRVLERYGVGVEHSSLPPAKTKPVPKPRDTSHLCGRCGRRAEKQCGRCEKVRYCDPTCQHADWPVHKQSCVTKNTV